MMQKLNYGGKNSRLRVKHVGEHINSDIGRNELMVSWRLCVVRTAYSTHKYKYARADEIAMCEFGIFFSE